MKHQARCSGRDQTEAFPHGAALAALDRILEAERALTDRARFLLDMSKLLSMVSAQQRAAPPKPRGSPMALARARGASRSGWRPCPPCMLCLRQKSSAKWRWSERICFFTHLRISSPMTIPDATRSSSCCPLFRAKDRLLKSWPELQIRITQLAREGSPPPGLRLPQAKLSRNSNQIARGRIRRIAVGTLITERPPHRTERAPFGHSAPTSGI
jgi:hypothetical protein